MSSKNGQWSDDFVKHLRTIHFTILALTGTLIVVATSDRYDAKASLPILDRIIAYCNEWPTDWIETQRPKDTPKPEPQTIDFYLPTTQEDTNELGTTPYWVKGIQYRRTSKNNSELVTNGLQQVHVTLNPPKRNWRAEQTITGTEYSFQTNATPATINADHAPTSLAAFRDWWDKTTTLHVTYHGFSLQGDANIAWGEQLNGQPWKHYVSYAPSPGEANGVAVLPLDPVDLKLSIDGHTYTAELPIPRNGTRYFHINAQPTSPRQTVTPWAPRSNSEGPTWEHRRQQNAFSDAFPELRGITPELSRLPLGELKTQLITEATDPKTLELGGLKIPVAQWGILLMLLVQTYFLMLIHEMTARADTIDASSVSVTWIGLFKSKTARLAFLSSLLAPALAVALLGTQLLPLTLVLAATTLSALVGFLTIKAMATITSPTITPQ